MAAQAEELLEFRIVEAPAELDFYYSFARGKPISLTLRAWNGATMDINVWVDCLDVPHPYALTGQRGEWEIRGRFYGDGVKKFQIFPIGRDVELTTHEYWIWGEFTAVYNRRTRKGVVRTPNYRKREVRKPIKLT